MRVAADALSTGRAIELFAVAWLRPTLPNFADRNFAGPNLPAAGRD